MNLYDNDTNDDTNEFVCEPAGNKWTYVFLMPLPILSGLINLLVWLAATFYRKNLLRHSYVYSCVTSTLLSNIVFLSFHLWDEIANFQMSEMSLDPHVNPRELIPQIIWSLCTAAAVAMMFVVCGNLTVLIYVLLDSAYYRKSACSQRLQAPKPAASDLQSKRRRAAFLVGTVWVLPFILTWIAVFSWNCERECLCPPGSGGEICPQSSGCSRVWMPMKNSFIAVNIGLLLIEVILLIYVTITGVRNFQKTNFRSNRSTTSTEDAVEFRKSDRSSGWYGSFHGGSITTIGEGAAKKDRSSKTENDGKFQDQPPKRVSRYPLSPRLRLVCYLTIVFIACTALVPIVFFIDISVKSYPIVRLRLASMVMVQVYTFLCPCLMVRYLSNLKLAINRMAASTLKCCK